MKLFRLPPWLLLLPAAAVAHSLPLVEDLEPQPLTGHVRDVVQAMAARGAPVPADELKALQLAFDRADAAAIQAAIDHPEDMIKHEHYPGGAGVDHWPTLGLNTLRWAKRQGAVAGAAHAALGMQVPTGEWPNFLPPPYSAGGANEYIVNVKVVVNGRPVAQRRVMADGRIQPVDFEVDIDRSSWIALRVYPSSHTNPIFVIVDGRPIRASRRSIAWCLEGVDLCWGQKQGFISRKEKAEAEAAYEHARQTYRRRLAECDIE